MNNEYSMQNCFCIQLFKILNMEIKKCVSLGWWGLPNPLRKATIDHGSSSHKKLSKKKEK